MAWIDQQIFFSRFLSYQWVNYYFQDQIGFEVRESLWTASTPKILLNTISRDSLGVMFCVTEDRRNESKKPAPVTLLQVMGFVLFSLYLQLKDKQHTSLCEHVTQH